MQIITITKREAAKRMQIITITKVEDFIVETDLAEWPTFRRSANGTWERLYGESWETEEGTEELEALFQARQSIQPEPTVQQIVDRATQKLEMGNVYVGDFGREIIAEALQEALSLEPTVTLTQAVAFFNEVLQCDPDALSKLMNYRVPCNDALAEHPTIGVRIENGESDVGFLGILNGLFGIQSNNTGYIAGFKDKDHLWKEFLNNTSQSNKPKAISFDDYGWS